MQSFVDPTGKALNLAHPLCREAGGLESSRGTEGAREAHVPAVPPCPHGMTTHGAQPTAPEIADYQQREHGAAARPFSWAPETAGLVDSPVLLHRAGKEEHAEWAFRRRAGPFFKDQCGRGNAHGSLTALKQTRSLSLVCRSVGCFALVDYKVARRQALQAGRAHF